MDGDRDVPVLLYVLIAFGRTWSLWWAAAVFTRLPGPLLSVLLLTGGIGPLLGAAWVVRRGGSAYR